MKTLMERRSNVDRGRNGNVALGGTPHFRRDPPRWLQHQSRLLMLLDALAAALATLTSNVWVFGWSTANLEVRSVQVPYVATVLVTVPIWLVVLTTYRCHDVGPFGEVKNETRRIVGAGANFLAVIAVGYYAVRPEHLGREFLIVIVPLAVGLTLLGRIAARYRLRLQRDRGQANRRALVMGPGRSVGAILEHLEQHTSAGMVGVATLITDDDSAILVGDTARPVVGSPSDLLDVLQEIDADLLLITGGLIPGELRKLTWLLENTGVEVLVAPTAAHLTGPQFEVRPVAGLPVLYVDRASFDGAADIRSGD